MASPIRATLLLCDAATVDPLQKVHMLGAGWSLTTSPTPPMAVVALVKIPWDRTNQKIPVRMRLVDADGQPVVIGGQAIERPPHDVEVGRPPGLAEGSDLDWAFQLSLPPLPLGPGRYTWVLEMAESQESISFEVRAKN